MCNNHEHKVNETRTRSLFKTLTARIIEIIVDTFLIGSVYFLIGIPHAYEIAGGISIVIEFLCALTNYLNDRLWNKIQWGREVEDVEETIKDKVELL